MDVCDSTGNIFVKRNVSIDSAIGYHRGRCDDDFMLNLLEIMPYFWSF